MEKKSGDVRLSKYTREPSIFQRPVEILEICPSSIFPIFAGKEFESLARGPVPRAKILSLLSLFSPDNAEGKYFSNKVHG